MNTLKGCILISFLLASQSYGAVYDCMLSYETYPDDQSPSIIENLDGIFNTSADDPSLYLEFTNHGRRNVSIYVEQDKKIYLQMGDYCGDQYQIIHLPSDPGAMIKNTISYGREGTNVWTRMTFECHRR
jgi:hypothetical protein